MRKLIFLIFIWNHLCFVSAQSVSDFAFKDTVQNIVQFHNHTNTAPIKTHFIKKIILSPIFVYQKFVSDQFQPLCVFHPSCSNFCSESIHEYGLLKAVLLTGDRLNRCSSINYFFYKRPKIKNLLDDNIYYYK